MTVARPGTAILASVLALGMALPAHAASPSAHGDASPYDEAVKAFKQGDFEHAIEKFEEAYAREKNPNFLYNIGRVYEEKGDLQQALAYYRRFIRAEGVDLDSRTMVSERIAKLKKVLGETGEEPEATATDGAQRQPPPPTVTQSSGNAQVEAELGDDALRRPGKLGVAGYTLLGIGAASLVAGFVVGGLAYRDDNLLDGNDRLDDPARVQERGEKLALAGTGLLSAAALPAVLGVVFVSLDAVKRRKQRNAGTMSWTPMLRGRTMGMGVQGRF